MRDKVSGILAEFDTPEEILRAAKQSREAGYRAMEGFTPYHIEGLAETLGFERSGVAPIVFGAGLLGTGTAYCLQYYVNGINYPLNVGGRPLNSLPSFIPVMFELTVLFASFGAMFGMFFLNGLPKPRRPIWNIERFRRASKDGFFLLVEARDPQFDREGTRHFLEGLRPKGIYELAA